MKDKCWERMRFDEFVERVNETVMPAQSHLDCYIGLEHLDTMDLTIRRWNQGRHLIGQKLVVRKGDIIIARRNWYLRRVAIAPFDALCSAHAMVVRPKGSKLHPDYLANFLLSDVFFQRALEISVGSLSPTINWSTLKSVEFILPPLNIQRLISESSLLSRTVKNLHMNSEEQMIEMYKLLLSSEFNYSLRELKMLENNDDIDFYRVNELAEISLSNVNKKSKEDEQPIKLCNYMDVYSNVYIDDHDDYMEATAKPDQIEKFSIRKNDILLTKDSETPDDIGVPAMVRDIEKPLVCGYHLAIIRPTSERINPKYLFHYLRSKICMAYFKMYAQGSTRFSLSKSVFENLPVPVPSINRQLQFVEMIEKVDIQSVESKPSDVSHEISKIILKNSAKEALF